MNKFLLASLIVLASVSTAQAHEEHGWDEDILNVNIIAVDAVVG